ncbi:MAG: heme o synthase [Phycisphaeraceae bacterium]|nr:heme o synthase [Phycisphaeraceae bacterium]
MHAPATQAPAPSIEPELKPGVDARLETAALGSLTDQFRSLVELSKPRITKLVVITAAVGFGLGVLTRFGGTSAAGGTAAWASWSTQEWLTLALSAAACLIGTGLSSGGASALNMFWERRRDGMMPRTADRPLPTHRIGAPSALVAGLFLSVAGVLVLSVGCGPAPALVSLATILLYVLVYTPLKTRTTFNTLVGTIPGALPPLIGWTAAATVGRSADVQASFAAMAEPAGWSLVILMVVWQIPHFFALAWMYRHDYAQGGYVMLPVVDPNGRATSAAVLAWSIALVPATLSPVVFMPDRLGLGYALVAGVSGVGFVILCARFARRRERKDAKRVFLASISHLPLIMIAMVVDGLWANA